MRRSCSLAAVVILACAAGCGPRHRPAPAGGDLDAGAPPAGDGDGDGDGATEGAAAPLTRDECVRMVDHVLDLGMAVQRARKAPEYVPTAEQVAKIRDQLIAEQLEPCLAMPRGQWDCAMAARTMDALYGCEPRQP